MVLALEILRPDTLHYGPTVVRLSVSYCALVHAYTYDIQIEQEFGLIVGKSHAKREFIAEWSTMYVPAIISYG